MDTATKKLAPGRIRFIVKKIDKLFRVYDVARGSFPYQSPELGGKIIQDVPEAEAQLEADRLNKLYGTPAPISKPKAEPKKPKKEHEWYKSKAKQQAEARAAAAAAEIEEQPEYFTPATEITEDDIADYGIMSEEERKKFEEGTTL